MASLIRIDQSLIQSIDASHTPSQIIRGIIGLQGIYDLADMLRDSPNYLDWVVRPAFGDGTPHDFEKVSPTYLLNANPIDTPDFLLIHSTHDELLRTTQTSRFFDKLIATSKDQKNVTLITPEDARLSHNAMVDMITGGYELISAQIFQFAQKLCKPLQPQ